MNYCLIVVWLIVLVIGLILFVGIILFEGVGGSFFWRCFENGVCVDFVDEFVYSFWFVKWDDLWG